MKRAPMGVYVRSITERSVPSRPPSLREEINSRLRWGRRIHQHRVRDVVSRYRIQVGHAVLLCFPEIDQHAARRGDAGHHFVAAESLERQHLEVIEQNLMGVVVGKGPLFKAADGDFGETGLEQGLGLPAPCRTRRSLRPDRGGSAR